MSPLLIVFTVKNVIEIDLRHLTGSLKEFITKEKTDAVIVMYNAEVPGINGKNFRFD